MAMKMIIFTFIYEERMERICLCLTMGELLRASNMAKYFHVLFMDWEDMNSHYSEKFSR